MHFGILIMVLFFTSQNTLFALDPWSFKTTEDYSRHGWLWYDGKLLPDCFDSITINGLTYGFKVAKSKTDDDGYFPVKKTVFPGTSDVQISVMELETGFYDGFVLKSGTPDNWVFVRWGKKTAIVDPDKIGAMISFHEISTIVRMDYKPDVTTTASP